MKKSIAVLLVVCLMPLLHAQKTRYGQSLPKLRNGVDYPMSVHIYATHYRTDCVNGGYCMVAVYADAVVGGKKVELAGDIVEHDKLHQTIALGDYPARIITKVPDPDLSGIGQKYELVTPDKYVWAFVVSGVAE